MLKPQEDPETLKRIQAILDNYNNQAFEHSLTHSKSFWLNPCTELENLNNFCPSRFSQVCPDLHFLQKANLYRKCV